MKFPYKSHQRFTLITSVLTFLFTFYILILDSSMKLHFNWSFHSLNWALHDTGTYLMIAIFSVPCMAVAGVITAAMAGYRSSQISRAVKG